MWVSAPSGQSDFNKKSDQNLENPPKNQNLSFGIQWYGAPGIKQELHVSDY